MKSRNLIPSDSEYLPDNTTEGWMDDPHVSNIGREKISSFFKSAKPRFDLERNKVPGPGHYKEFESNSNVYHRIKKKNQEQNMGKEYRNFSKENRDNLMEKFKKSSIGSLHKTADDFNKGTRDRAISDSFDEEDLFSQSVCSSAIGKKTNTTCDSARGMAVTQRNMTFDNTAFGFQRTKGMPKWSKATKPFREYSYIPKHDPKLGPGTFDNDYDGKPLYKYKPSCAFSSKIQKDTKIEKPTHDMDVVTAIKVQGNPGPGSYPVNDNMLENKRKTNKNKFLYPRQTNNANHLMRNTQLVFL
jgi:hypothetical protein